MARSSVRFRPRVKFSDGNFVPGTIGFLLSRLFALFNFGTKSPLLQQFSPSKPPLKMNFWNVGILVYPLKQLVRRHEKRKQEQKINHTIKGDLTEFGHNQEIIFITQ